MSFYEHYQLYSLHQPLSGGEQWRTIYQTYVRGGHVSELAMEFKVLVIKENI
jgi:hypothetical protein